MNSHPDFRQDDGWGWAEGLAGHHAEAAELRLGVFPFGGELAGAGVVEIGFADVAERLVGDGAAVMGQRPEFMRER